ncbi:hypothetical protein V1503_24620 [Bacillus sp. SCS-151]|uniref:hypothetical protein n=1 Tax=Nanhaiella sioensis TaxID=3115293 RepID=UPI0039782EB9
MRFIIWIFFSIIISIAILYRYWPDYRDNEFPLFTDIVMPIFLMSYYMTFFAIPSLLLLKFGKRLSVNFIITCIIFLLSFLFSLFVLKFSSVVIEIVISLVVSLLAWFYIIVSVAFLLKSK